MKTTKKKGTVPHKQSIKLIEFDGTTRENVSTNALQLILNNNELTMANVNQILTQEGFNVSYLLNVYLFGSRLHGTATQQSDYDIICVMEDGHERTERHPLTNRKTALIQVDQCDIIVYSRRYFTDRLKQFSIIEFMLLWSPVEFRWKESFALNDEFRESEDTIPEIDMSQFRCSISLQARNKWQMAKEVIQSYNEKQEEVRTVKELRQAKKIIAHCMRIFLLAIQIAKSGRITDFSDGNRFMSEDCEESKLILDPTVAEWNDLNSYYRPIFNNLHSELRKVAPK